MPEGKIYIIGAGPGDPELLTIKAVRCLQECSVVFHEEGIAPEILENAKKEAVLEVLESGDGTSMEKEPLQKILGAALKGETVGVVLEGDPFIFGQGAEIAREAAKNGLKFVPIPGITSASAAAVYAGIPLTYRGYASTLAFAIGHSDLNRRYTDVDWARVALGMQTLVFFINADSLAMVIENLLNYGRDARTPAAIVSLGTRRGQRTMATTLGELNAMNETEIKAVPMPAVLIVGDVVGLRQELKWFE